MQQKPERFALPVIGQRSRSVPQALLADLSAEELALAQLPLHALFGRFKGAPRALYMKFHLGGCGSCSLPLDDSLALLCRDKGISVRAALECVRLSAEFEQELRLSPRALADALAAGQRIRLLDARGNEEWIAARIRGAIHLTDQRVKGILQSWPRNTAMVVYDHLGFDTTITVDYFIGNGFTNVRCLDGGIDAWSQQVDPTVRRYRLEYPAPPPGVPASHSKKLL